MPAWNAFPHPDPAYDFAGPRLKNAWSELHAGDCEPFPRDAALQEAWRSFHAGDFQAAVEQAEEIGLAAHAVANKATGIYATYLEDNPRRQQSLFMEAIERAEQAIEAYPDDPNAHYFHAFNLGRYSQSISVVKALKQGVGGKIHKSLQQALELQPDHAEAHTALGMYHAEIIDKVGKLIGGMTYQREEGARALRAGAEADAALADRAYRVRQRPLPALRRRPHRRGVRTVRGRLGSRTARRDGAPRRRVRPRRTRVARPKTA